MAAFSAQGISEERGPSGHRWGVPVSLAFLSLLEASLFSRKVAEESLKGAL